MATDTNEKIEARQATYGRIEHVPADGLLDNPWQPRTSIDPAQLQDLADSIYTQGLLQPPIARPSANGAATFELAFGHRRVAAIRLLAAQGRWTGDVPVSLQDLSDEDMALLALAENSNREDLTAIETYRSYARILEEIPKLTIQKLAESVGLERPTLSNNLRILKLPAVVLERVEAGEMSVHAAREFLCLQNDEHAHEREMAVAINDIARTSGVDGAPDWRVKNVRTKIRDAVIRHDKDWRPLAEREGDLSQDYGYFGAAASREPSFDVGEFLKENQGELHTIPRADGKSRLWTCNPKAWRRAQSAATRAANVNGASEDSPTPASSAAAEAFPKTLAKDPLLKSIRAVARETGEPVGKKGELTDAEREALGTRAKPTGRLGYDTFNATLRVDNYHMPSYFPDLAECLERCNFGATYVSDYDGFRLQCLNQKHFEEKVKAGEKAYKTELADRKRSQDAFDAKLAAVLETQAPGNATAAVIATVLLKSLDFRPIRPEAGFEFAYHTGALSKVAAQLGVKLNKADRFSGSDAFDREKAIKALGELSSSDLANTVANLVVWGLRRGSDNGVLDVDALIVSVTSAVFPPAERSSRALPVGYGDTAPSG